MSIRTLIPALALTACGAGETAHPFSGLWLLQMGQAEQGEEETTCDENFIDASCPAETEGEYVFDSEGEVSDSLQMVEILVGPDSNMVLVYEGQFYPGTLEEGKMVFTLSRSEESTSTTEHISGLYVETSTVSGTITETLSLTQDEEVEGIWRGSWRMEEDTAFTWTQTDEWDPEEIPEDEFAPSPPLSNPFSSRLEVDEDVEEGPLSVTNTPEPECSGSTCNLEITSSRSATIAIPVAWQVQDVGFSEEGNFTEVATPGGLSGSMSAR